MSSLVPDFFLNPVLRQARRFSRSNQPDDRINPITNQRTSFDNNHEIAVEDVVERFDALSRPGTAVNAASESISGTDLTSSPVQEEGGLEAELRALQDGRRSGALSTLNDGQAQPIRTTSLRSEPSQINNEVSNNPLHGITSRIRAGSTTSSILSLGSRTIMNSRVNSTEATSAPSQYIGSQGSGNLQGSSSLPEDDGMGPLRQQIISIQDLDISAEEKARLMHNLLTQSYNQLQETSRAKQPASDTAPEVMISQERPTTPSSLSSFIWQMNGPLDIPTPGQQHTFHLSHEDLRPTYAPVDSGETDEDGDFRVKDGQVQLLGCQHYKRNVKLQCSTCDRWYTCRLCHDDVEKHVLIRKETKNMLCMICGCAQRAGEFCVGCGERTAWYYCGVCKLWDNDANKCIYHCSDCGICRKGRGLGKDFFHCKTCATCMSMSVEQSHKCIERASDCDCPICGDYMFTSPSPVVFMLCGHGIHKACYDAHMKSSYKCPICSKSTVNMESQFRNLDRAVDSQPMPPQFQDTKAMVSCNDCYAKSAVKYHWLGLKCAICDSYNTVQLSILSDAAVEVPVLETGESDEAIVDMGPVNEEALMPTTGTSLPQRSRRHSSYMEPLSSSAASRRFSPYARPQRFSRSVSPGTGRAYFDNNMNFLRPGANDSADEDDMDFWGRGVPRNVTSAEVVNDAMEEIEESDDDSAMEDCIEEDVEDEDQFEIFGHR